MYYLLTKNYKFMFITFDIKKVLMSLIIFFYHSTFNTSACDN